MASAILLRAQLNKRTVWMDMLLRFCGVFVSLTLSMPLSRSCTRSLFFDMSRTANKERAQSQHRLAERRTKREEDFQARTCAERRSSRPGGPGAQGPAKIWAPIHSRMCV